MFQEDRAGLENARVVVTGGKGFLGSYVVEALVERGGAKVLPIDEHDFDLVSWSAVDRMYEEIRPTHVIHLAAAVGGIGANVERPGLFSYANTVMGAHVLEGARLHGVRKVTMIGTICVYPADAPTPIVETAMFQGFPAEATAAYGEAKRNLWVMGAAYRKQYGLDVIYLIPTNLFGPRDHFGESRSHVLPALIRRFEQAREDGLDEVVIWGDGTATREFLFAADAARGIVEATAKYSAAEPVNLGTGQEVTIRGLAEMTARACDFTGRLVFDATRPTGAQRRSLDVRRARETFGFEARVGLEEGLARTVAWYRAHRPGAPDS